MRTTLFNLTGRVAVITGAGSGIGAATAQRFAAAGARVYVADRDSASGESVAMAIRVAGGWAKFIAVDVADEASCRSVATRVLEANDNRCDILVNNAGIGHVGTVLTTTGGDLDRLHAVNVKGILHMTQPLLPSMIARRSGSVISLASIGGIVAVRDRLAYCATKFAVVGMTKCMALDHAESQVRFNCICPGRVETPFVQARIAEYPDPAKAYADMIATQPIGRMARPDEIAAAIHYLASDESAFVTGSALIIDGGWSAGK
jgi:NAD(P)-dependent dehydrogenase (short-subunit alcohol dehydrogenase family)